MAGTHAVMENKYNHVTPGKVVRIIVLIALLLFLAAPLLWQISLAFKGPKDDMYAAPYLIPVDPTIQNFVDVFNRLPLLFYVCNTLIVAALNIGGNIIRMLRRLLDRPAQVQRQGAGRRPAVPIDAGSR